jgi:hypothetical protein
MEGYTDYDSNIDENEFSSEFEPNHLTNSGDANNDKEKDNISNNPENMSSSPSVNDEILNKLKELTIKFDKLDSTNKILMGMGEKEKGQYSYIKPVEIEESQQKTIDFHGFRSVENAFKLISFGNKSHENVVDFLYSVNRTQQTLKLNEKELIRMMGSRVNLEVATLYHSFERQNYNLAQIYEALYRHYNRDLEPATALRVMSTYRIPSNFSVLDLLSDVRSLTDMSCNNCLDDTVRESSRNERALTLYLNQTPPFISSIVGRFVDMFQKTQNKYPNLSDIEERLQNDITVTNRELKQLQNSPSNSGYTFGKARQTMNFKSFMGDDKKDSRDTFSKGRQDKQKGKGDKKVFTLSQDSKSTTRSKDTTQHRSDNYNKSDATESIKNKFVHSAREGIKEKYGHKVTTKHINAIQNSMQDNVKRKFINKYADGKRYCSLCSSSSHNAIDNCYAMFNNEYVKQQNVVPAMGYCTYCFDKLKLKLHHTRVLCPLRREAIQGYKDKKIRPIGVFRTYFEKFHQ